MEILTVASHASEGLKLFSAFILAIVAQLIPPVQPDFAARFEQLEFRPPSDSGRPPCRYRLYVPPGASTDSRRPLILWLHGYNERGDDNTLQLTWLDLLFEQPQRSPPPFILAVQHPANASWSAAQAPNADSLSVAYQILCEVLRNHPVDPERVYVSGVSAGGNACWEIAARHPTTFAAVAPLAASEANVSLTQALVNVPVWAFHSENDTQPTPDGSSKMVEALHAAGGEAHLTLTKANLNWEHDCWRAAFRDHDLLAWMLAQRRGALLVTWPPGRSPIPVWTYATWGGLFIIVVLAIAGERRRRRRVELSPAVARM